MGVLKRLEKRLDLIRKNKFVSPQNIRIEEKFWKVFINIVTKEYLKNWKIGF